MYFTYMDKLNDRLCYAKEQSKLKVEVFTEDLENALSRIKELETTLCNFYRNN